jgi:hypothetical protein
MKEAMENAHKRKIEEYEIPKRPPSPIIGNITRKK